MPTEINTKELIVTQTKAVKKTLNMAILFIVACLSIIGKVYNIPSRDGVKIFILGVLGCLLIFLLIRLFQFLKLYISKTPAMIINSEGLWIKEFGIIPWQNITQIEEYNPFKVPFGFENNMSALGINLHDTALVLENASPIGKRALRLALYSKKHHITLMDMDTQVHEIVNYAHQFMDNV